jgi:bifunctional NMN adenylyltransferase/nudix hydrolase
MKYDNLVFIGRFAPFHLGHKAVIDKALEISEHVTIVLGSHDSAPSTRNPFTTQQRIEMISGAYSEDQNKRIRFVPQVDHTYNFDRWISGVQSGVEAAESSYGWKSSGTKTGIVGYEKDESSFYLKAFPMWERVDFGLVARIDATSIRKTLFEESFTKIWGIPDNVFIFMRSFVKSAIYLKLVDEWDFVKRYKKQWEASPYPPTFVTADAVVVQSGHVLLVERGAAPGEGLLALPGGFVNQFEEIDDAVFRELREETRISVPEPILRGSVTIKRVFDGPWRSERGRTITHAYLIKLNDMNPLPKIKGGDDAKKAMWVPFSELRRSNMFEDHAEIISNLTGV